MGGPAAPSGKTLGRYELICEVAKGQLGPLWAARQGGSDNAPVVLIRRVSTAAPTTPDEIDSLSEGAWWMLEIQDAGLAKGIDVVKTEGELGVVTEYAEGEVLRSLLRLASFKRKPIAVGIALRIGLDVLDALEQANLQAQPASNGQTSLSGGLIPDSVLVGRDGRSRLLDVGILGPATKVVPIARHPEMAAYAAPEQLADPTNADLRASLYAVGVMMWEMLSGKRLFVGSTHQAVVEKVKAGGIIRLDLSRPVGGEGISSQVADVIAKALDGNPDARYATPGAMAEALRNAAGVASHEQVAALIEDLAGNTLASRKKLVEKAKPTPTLPKPTRSVPPPARAKGNGGPARPEPHKAVQAPPQRKSALVGIQPLDLKPPPPPKLDLPAARPPIESLDEEALESVSKIEAFPAAEPATRPAPKVMEGLLAKEKQAAAPAAAVKDVSPKPPEVSGEGHIKTQLFGSQAADPAKAIAAAKAEEASKAGADKPSPFGPNQFGLGVTPKPPEVSPPLPPLALKADAPKPALDGVEELPVESLDSDDLDDDMTEKLPAIGDGEKQPEKKPDSAVAWVGPPPGVALDDDGDDVAPASNVPERTQKMRKIVGAGIGAAAGLILLVMMWRGFGSKKEDGSDVPTGAAKTGVSEMSKVEPVAEPKTEAKTEPPPTTTAASEPKTEPPSGGSETAAKTDESKTEEKTTESKSTASASKATTAPAPKAVTAKATVRAPKTTTSAAKPKSGKKYTPSGI